MKKFIITTLLALSVCSTALAADLFTERFYAFSNRDKEVIDEVNYYLERGGIVKALQLCTRGVDGTFTCLIVKIPSDVFATQRYQKPKN